MRTYLVTGGLGFLGASLVRELIKDGAKVRILDNVSRGALRRLGDVKSETEIINGDIRDPSIVSQAISGVDSVFHLAYVNGTEYFYEHPEYVLDVGVKGMVNVLDSCIRHEVGELILASSSEVYQTPAAIPTDESIPLLVPDPLNPRYSYGGGKIISELMALNYGRKYFEKVLIFRPHNVFGPDMGWEHVIPQFVSRLWELKEKAKSNEISFPIQGTGEETRSFVYIDDFTTGLMQVLKQGEHLGIYNIGVMDEVKISSIAHRIGNCMGLNIKIVPGPQAVGGTPRRCPDTSKLHALGFRPSFSLDDSLPHTVQWYIDNPRPPQTRKPLAGAKIYFQEY